jgi:hypothetical protein
MIAFATEAARDAVVSMEPDSPCAVKVSKLENLDYTISNEVTRLCNEATLSEMSKTFILIRRLKKASEHEKQTTTSELRRITEKLIERVESKSGPLKLPEVCLHLFSEV